MPEPITGTAVAALEQAMVTDDAGHMILTYKKHDGTTENLAIPAGQLGGLLELTMQCNGRIQQKKGLRTAVPAESWEIHVDDEDRMIFTVGLAGGAWLAFVLPLESRQQVMSMSELLARRAGEDDKTKH